MGSKITVIFFIFLIFMVMSLPPTYSCVNCQPPHSHPPYHRPSLLNDHPNPPSTKHPPHHGGSGHRPKVPPPSKRPPIIATPIIFPPQPVTVPPITNPPVITPPITNPPVTITPSSSYPPYTPPGGIIDCGGGGGDCGGGSGGNVPGLNPPPITQPRCPINALKLGLCLDVLGGLVHVGIGNPVENACCPVLRGLLELEAAICLCTTIRIKLLNLKIYIPLALQVMITCGRNPPPGFICPPL